MFEEKKGYQFLLAVINSLVNVKFSLKNIKENKIN